MRREHGIEGYDVQVTAGCNQAFANVVAAVMDEGSEAVIFSPVYFNHVMALQLGGAKIVTVPCGPDLTPDPATVPFTDKTRMVVVITPCNPTGAVVSGETLKALAEACRARNVWLVIDYTYLFFTYDGVVQDVVSGDNVILLFSFSKAFGMPGFRVGWIGYPAARKELALALGKVQDCVVISASIMSQNVALGALQAGAPWVKERLKDLEANREAVWAAISSAPRVSAKRTAGAFYFFVKLPEGAAGDVEVAEWLVKEHGVAVVAGTVFGCPGHLRVCYGNLPPDRMRAAAARLGQALLAVST